MNLKVLVLTGLASAMLIANTASTVMAQKKKDRTPARFTPLEIPIDGTPFRMNEPTLGPMSVIINGSDDGKGSAAYARVDKVNLKVDRYGFLPEPLYADENGVFENGPSTATDVNDGGIIVGRANAFEIDPDYTESELSPGRGIVWSYDGTKYTYEQLPSLDLAETGANGINNLGEIVGKSNGRAVYWDPLTHEIEDLNTTFTAAFGWDLISAHEINDNGMVIGVGNLGEKRRGFLLDIDSGSIWAVPLIGPADANSAYQINANGRVVGSASDGNSPTGTNPDYFQGYSWDGPGSDPVVLESVTDNTSLAVGMNDAGATVGYSYILTSDFFNNVVPTLWKIDIDGNVVATNLSTEVSGKNWYLTYGQDINNDGWISVRGRTRRRGRYLWRAVLLVPNQ